MDEMPEFRGMPGYPGDTGTKGDLLIVFEYHEEIEDMIGVLETLRMRSTLPSASRK